MKVALVHEWLTDWGGSESVLAAISHCVGAPDIFALIDFLQPEQRARLNHAKIETSFVQSLPLARTRFWNYLALMPFAVEQFDLRAYDLIVSSNHAFAKGALTNANQVHVCYIHSPMRYIWDLYQDYLADYGLNRGIKGWLVKCLFHRLRSWDVRSSMQVDHFVANSEYVARRVWKTYRRRAEVIYPPVDIDRFSPSSDKGDYYLTVSRLVSYKKIGMIVEAFRALPDKQLLVIGDGPEMQAVRRLAGPNVRLMGAQPDQVVADYMRGAKAFVFAAIEDFGITPVEAQACGTSVIALRSGGACETVCGLGTHPNPTGLFFDRQAPEDIADAVRRFEAGGHAIDPADCRKNAERFSRQRFSEEFSACIATRLVHGPGQAFSRHAAESPLDAK